MIEVTSTSCCAVFGTLTGAASSSRENTRLGAQARRPPSCSISPLALFLPSTCDLRSFPVFPGLRRASDVALHRFSELAGYVLFPCFPPPFLSPECDGDAFCSAASWKSEDLLL